MVVVVLSNNFVMTVIMFILMYFVIIASAFMFSIIESCNMNKLSPGWYIKELVSCLTAKPCSDVEKVAILPCIIQK